MGPSFDKKGKTAVLHDKLLAAGPLRTAPAYVGVPILEPIGCRTPEKQGDPCAFALDDQPQRVAGRVSFAHVVVLPF